MQTLCTQLPDVLCKFFPQDSFPAGAVVPAPSDEIYSMRQGGKNRTDDLVEFGNSI